MNQVRLNPASNAVFSAINADARAEILNQLFQHGAHIFILAGALRDAIAAYYEGEAAWEPRDFDIAIANVSRELFDEILLGWGKRNRHGGYVLSRQGSPDWDVWRLEETIGLKKTGTACSIENVLRTFNLNCNAIALDVRTGLFLDGGAIEAIRHKRLDFASGAIRHSADTFAAKALLLNLRLQYELAAGMKRFVSSHLESAALLHEAGKVFPNSVVLQPPELSS